MLKNDFFFPIFILIRFHVVRDERGSFIQDLVSTLHFHL